MTPDFLAWFLLKHWIIAALLFPELALVWNVWMRNEKRAVALGLYVFCVRFAFPIYKNFHQYIDNFIDP